MSDGLITRVGKWIDSKFEDKATEVDLKALESQFSVLRLLTYDGLTPRITDVERRLNAIPADLSRYLDDLRGRVEKIELYAGMTRKVDPTKPAVAKSAFSM